MRLLKPLLGYSRSRAARRSGGDANAEALVFALLLGRLRAPGKVVTSGRIRLPGAGIDQPYIFPYNAEKNMGGAHASNGQKDNRAEPGLH